MPSDAKNWSANQLRFMAWLSIPAQMRKPRYQGEFAKKYGINEATLSRWKKLPGFVDDVAELSRDQVRDELAEIYGALVKRARSGSFPHIKLALELAGHYVEKRVIGGDADLPIKHEHHHEHTIDLETLSDEELQEYDRILSKIEESSRYSDGAFPSPN